MVNPSINIRHVAVDEAEEVVGGVWEGELFGLTEVDEGEGIVAGVEEDAGMVVVGADEARGGEARMAAVVGGGTGDEGVGGAVDEVFVFGLGEEQGVEGTALGMDEGCGVDGAEEGQGAVGAVVDDGVDEK